MSRRIAYYLLAQLRVDLSAGRVGLERFVISSEREPKGGPPGTVWAEVTHVETFSEEMARQTMRDYLDPYLSVLGRIAHHDRMVEPPTYNLPGLVKLPGS